MKIAGIILIMTGCVGVGISIVNQWNVRVSHLHQMQEMFELLKSQVYYQKSTFPECCREVSKKIKDPFSDALIQIHNEFMKRNGISLENIWIEVFRVFDKKINVNKEEKELLYDFATKIGHYDILMQQKAMEQVIEEVEKRRKKAEISVAEKGKLAFWLSTMGGMFLVILFI